MNIIVRMPNWIGDLVMATSVLVDLRNAFPNACITAMCRTPLCDLLKEEKAIDELFCFTRPSNQFLRREEMRNIIAKIAEGKHDVGILLTNSFSSAWWFWQGNVKRRIGYGERLRRILLTDPVSHQKQHQVLAYKQLLTPLGIPISNTMPRIIVTEKEVRESRTLLYQRGYRDGQKLIGINPGAAYGSAKCWPADRYRALAIKLMKETDAKIVFFGDSSTKMIAQDLPVIHLAGVTNLRELACLIQDCDMFVTNDSGPMHMAAAVGTPLVALFGSTDDTLTGPYGQSESVINKRVACSPCFKRKCPIDFKCMNEISVDEVAERVKRGLNV